MSKKSKMSRRIHRQYVDILEGDGGDWCHWGWWGRTKSENNAAAALFFYKQFGSRAGVDFHRLQNIVLRGSADLVYRWAMEVPESNKKRCEAVLMEKGTPQQMRTFAQNVPGARLEALENLAVIKEVLAA